MNTAGVLAIDQTEEVKIAPFWGYYRQLHGMWVWEHNPNLRLTVDEQYEANCRNFPDFKCVQKGLAP